MMNAHFEQHCINLANHCFFLYVEFCCYAVFFAVVFYAI